MSVGMILLTVTAILVFFGVAQRVLDKLYLTDRAALLLIALMFFGTLLPSVTIGRVVISLGGAVIPLGICLYLLIRADTGREKARALLGAAITAGAVYLIGVLMPEEPEAIVVDPMFLYGIAGGVVAYALGRSRRAAFICGVLGVLLADTAVAVMNWQKGIEQPLMLGGAGVFDAAVIAGLLGVVLAELTGEVLERLSRGSEPPQESHVHHPVRRRRSER